MDIDRQALEDALAAARPIWDQYKNADGTWKQMPDDVRTNLVAKTAHIAELRKSIGESDRIKAALADLPLAAGEGVPGGGSDAMFAKNLADHAAFKFNEGELQTLQKAVESGTGYRVKAVQGSGDFQPGAGAVLDFGIAPAVRSRFRLASLIPTKTLGTSDPEAGNDVTYFRPATLATGGTAVAEAAALPQSSPTWVAVTEPIRKVGHYGHIPDEAIQDWGSFLNVLGQEMIDGLISVENAQLLVGSGVAPNLAGIFDDSRSVTQRVQGTDTVIDTIMKALDDVRSLGFVEPDAIVMRSADWTPIRLSKTADDDYYFNPVGVANAGVKTVDGVPVYLCEQGAAGHIYVGQFSSLRAYLRKPPSLESTNSADDDFTKDLTKVRVIERVALAVPSAVKFCDVTLA